MPFQAHTAAALSSSFQSPAAAAGHPSIPLHPFCKNAAWPGLSWIHRLRRSRLRPYWRQPNILLRQAWPGCAVPFDLAKGSQQLSVSFILSYPVIWLFKWKNGFVWRWWSARQLSQRDSCGTGQGMAPYSHTRHEELSHTQAVRFYIRLFDLSREDKSHL